MDQWQDHQTFMVKALMKAASHFGVQLSEKPVFGWNDRSSGSKVTSQQGNYWLRVVSEMKHWAQGDFWEGNVAANEIDGIAKPMVLHTVQWEEGIQLLRAELMTFAEGHVCSKTPELRTYLNLPDSWWSELRASIDTLSAWSTERINTEQDKVTRRFLVFYGDDVDSKVTHWTTAHAISTGVI